MSKELSNSATVVEAAEKHLPGMARCHIQSFPGRFMTEMGSSWLCALYRNYIEDPGGIGCVAVDAKGNLVGFAVGGRPDMRDGFVNTALYKHTLLVLMGFLRSGHVRRVLLKELRKKLFKRPEKDQQERVVNTHEPGTGDLLSIGVMPDHQGTGIAAELLTFYQDACRKAGYERLTLLVMSDNRRAIAFYHKLGWTKVDERDDSSVLSIEL